MHSAQREIDRARFWALTTPQVAFYGALACNLTDVIDDQVETASTDGKRIRWNPQFVAGLTPHEVRFVLLHEVLHCAHGHFWRLPITTEGNIAGDYVINRTLRSIGGITAPKGALDDRRFDKLAEEEVLKALRQQPQPQPQPQQQPQQQPQPQQGSGAGEPQDGGDGAGDTEATPDDSEAGKPQQAAPQRPSDKGGSGGFEAPAPDAPADEADDDADGKPAKSGKPVQPASLREQWERHVVQAAQVAQSLEQGNLPAEARRLLDRVRAAARPDWRSETADFLKSTVADRADWSRQARRTALAPVLYPRRRPDSVGTVVVVRDTSGSVDTALVSKFNAHVRDMVADINCEVVMLDADAAVQAEYRIAAGDEVPDRAEGGGGTDFRPAFARVRELEADGERIAGVVYLTDLAGTFPSWDETGDTPVLWVATTDLTAPVGRTVRIDA